jgi:hypothetical protein
MLQRSISSCTVWKEQCGGEGQFRFSEGTWAWGLCGFGNTENQVSTPMEGHWHEYIFIIRYR